MQREIVKIEKYLRDKWRHLSGKHRRNVLVALGVTGLVIFSAIRGKRSTANLEPAEVSRLSAYTEEALCTARPRAMAETFLAVQRGGRLDRILKNQGDPVKAGDIIAVVDEVANSAGLKSALSAFRYAQADDGRIAPLFRSGAVTREEFDATRSRLEVKRAELEQARQRVEDAIVRSPVDGVVSTIVFKVGDKIPDGGRIAAVEDPEGTQATCRMPAESAARISGGSGTEQKAIWVVLDDNPPTTIEAPVRVTALQSEGGFRGLDVDVRIETRIVQAKNAIGKLTEIRLPLQEHTDVAKVSSLAIVRREGGSYVLFQQPNGAYSWQKISVLNQNAQEAIVVGVPADLPVFLLKDDLSKIETLVKH